MILRARYDLRLFGFVPSFYIFVRFGKQLSNNHHERKNGCICRRGHTLPTNCQLGVRKANIRSHFVCRLVVRT